MKLVRIVSLLTITAIVSLGLANGQDDKTTPAHFDQYGLALDYPADWQLIDNSNKKQQRISLISHDGVARILAIVHSELPISCEPDAGVESATDKLLDEIARDIHTEHPLNPVRVVTKISNTETHGKRISGLLNGIFAVGEVYSW